ncbi:NAD-dependent epimerase/dehydratase family protein [Candidatus Uhrbacteria bacterium]|nr:NAD-dependent epimerase/dehydratase family protein [Candidatus Uhrbacteria bacterium]
MDSLKKEKVLVTGGAGFIGSHLVERLVEAGHDVLVVDALTTGKREYVHPKARFVSMDVWYDYKKLQKLIVKERPDVTFHLAAHKDVRASIQRPIDDAHTNIIGTLNVLEGVRKAGGGRVVLTSSIAVCSADAKLPIEETCAIRPSSPYGISKHAAEMYMWHYSELNRMACVSLRLTNVYGPRQSLEGAGVITIFIKKMLSGEAPTIFGSGAQTRDFVYVDDVVDALLRIMTIRH